MFICYAIYSVKRLFQYAIGMVMLGKSGDSYLFSAPEFPDLAHGIRQKMGNCPHFSPTAPRSPWQNPYSERLNGSAGWIFGKDNVF